MITLGVNVAIFLEQQILLAKREDFEVWCLPGGRVEPNESMAEAALREVKEEVGLEIELTRLVGVYSLPKGKAWSIHVALFAAKPLTQKLKLQEEEIIDAKFFSKNKIPYELLWGHQQRIEDAFQGVGGGVAWSQSVTGPFKEAENRKELYKLRDKSDLSRQEFYLQYYNELNKEEDTQEV